MILCDFVKIPQSFFVPKMTAPFTREPLSDSQRLLRAIRCKRRRIVGTALAAVRNPQKLVATASRREGVYNRTGEPSVIFAEEEELHSE